VHEREAHDATGIRSVYAGVGLNSWGRNSSLSASEVACREDFFTLIGECYSFEGLVSTSPSIRWRNLLPCLL
jgi:hypothetical protein